MLAPMTTTQSLPDGRVSDAEIRWLTERARGGFAHIVTSAAPVTASAGGPLGALGIYHDAHIPGLRRLTSAVHSEGSKISVQLNHWGIRGVDNRVGPSRDAERRVRALTVDEIEDMLQAFVAAARRAELAGFDGVQLHAAHGFLIAQFLSLESNRRGDEYGGRLANRCRFLLRLIEGIREECGPHLQLGVRLSAERHGTDFSDALAVAEVILTDERVDMLDMSLWDIRKHPADPRAAAKPVLQQFLALRRNAVRLGVAGRITDSETVNYCLATGADYVSVGRTAILHSDFPRRCLADRRFEPLTPPVTRDYLRRTALSDTFIDYLAGWTGLVRDDAAAPALDPCLPFGR